MNDYISKPVRIQALLWTGDNLEEAITFAEGNFAWIDPEERVEDPDATACVFDKLHSTWILIYPGQYLVRGTKGEYYPCDPEVFAEKYEVV